MTERLLALMLVVIVALGILLGWYLAQEMAFLHEVAKLR
jgi:hypothetical protein